MDKSKLFNELIIIIQVKGIVQLKIKICWKCIHTLTIQDVDEFVSSSDLEKCSTASLAHQWILCPVHQLTYVKWKTMCLQETNPSRCFITSHHCLVRIGVPIPSFCSLGWKNPSPNFNFWENYSFNKTKCLGFIHVLLVLAGLMHLA